VAVVWRRFLILALLVCPRLALGGELYFDPAGAILDDCATTLKGASTAARIAAVDCPYVNGTQRTFYYATWWPAGAGVNWTPKVTHQTSATGRVCWRVQATALAGAGASGKSLNDLTFSGGALFNTNFASANVSLAVTGSSFTPKQGDGTTDCSTVTCAGARVLVKVQREMDDGSCAATQSAVTANFQGLLLTHD